MQNKHERWKPFVVSPNISVLSAIQRMDEIRCKLLIVMEEGTFISLLSIGDIQRAIIKNIPLGEQISRILRDDIIVCKEGDTQEKVRAEMLRCRAAFMPILDRTGKLKNICFWEDFFPDKSVENNATALDLPVVIMAGGLGKRLRPLTNVVPKPLLPFGGKTLVEVIMGHFRDAGCKRFFMSINYKAALIRSYFSELSDSSYELEFFEEKAAMGTVGSLTLMADKLKSTFFVSTCDNIISDNYGEILRYHKESRNMLTIVAALKHVKLPYGSIVTGDDGLLKEMSEKPEWVFKINSGFYVFEPELITLIPSDTYFDINHLIDLVMQKGMRIGVFPISEGSWQDIGSWDSYRLNVNV